MSSNKIFLSILSSTPLLIKSQKTTKQKKTNLKNWRNKICLLRMRQKDIFDIGLIFYLLLIWITIFPMFNIDVSPPLELWGHLCWEEYIHGICANFWSICWSCEAPLPLRALSPRLSDMFVSTSPTLATDSLSGDGFI